MKLEKIAEDLEHFTDEWLNYPQTMAEKTLERITYPKKEILGAYDDITIRASGDGIAFDEWGAGFVAVDEQTIEDGTVVGKNTWSREHAKTYDYWLKKRKGKKKYPYNRKPKHIMTDAASWLTNEIGK